ncbi:MAG: hypothetical protein HY913_04370 [Desulfomonile tiedjei]|nr:hypothetical protein [Desulfomonile tiedjei]
MNWIAKWFLGMAITTNIASLVYVYSNAREWEELHVKFAFVACMLIFLQFIVRYIAITNRFKTETTRWALITSGLIVAMSLISILNVPNGASWFLYFGLLLIVAPIKTQTSRRRIMESDNPDAERLMRLQEYMIFEGGFGCFMLFMYVLNEAQHNLYVSAYLGPYVNTESITFFGSLFALYYALVSTSVIFVRMEKDRFFIDQLIKAQD